MFLAKNLLVQLLQPVVKRSFIKRSRIVDFRLLDLRLLEKQFNNKIIDIDSYDYDFSSYECSNEEFNEEHKKKLLGFTRFSNLVKENENNLYTIMKYLWDDILCVHPTTKYIFLKDKSFDIQNQSTYKKLIDKLQEIT